MKALVVLILLANTAAPPPDLAGRPRRIPPRVVQEWLDNQWAPVVNPKFCLGGQDGFGEPQGGDACELALVEV